MNPPKPIRPQIKPSITTGKQAPIFNYNKDRLKKDLNAFIHHESFGGILLFFCVVFAMLVANSKFSALYFALKDLELGIFLGPYDKGMSVEHFINDVAMSLFFLMMGLEMKREILYGELAGFKKVIFPMLGALGGIIVPIGIYLVFNYGTPSANGFGVAMSTDTAFALGAILLLGKRVPLSCKVFLVTLAVVDDLVAILVIVLFYTAELHIGWLCVAGIIFGLLIYLNYKDNSRLSSFLLLGMLLWIAVFNSGVHATVAAVLLAFCIPGRSNVSDTCLLGLKKELEGVRTIMQGGGNFFETNIQHAKFSLKRLFANLAKFFADDSPRKQFDLREQSKRVQILDSISRYSSQAQNPLLRLQNILHPLCSYGIVPIFAFVNAGVQVQADTSFNLNNIFLGTAMGLVVGKPIGIFLFAWLGVKLGIATKPQSLRFTQVFATGALAGIGFTMSIFVANLAYANIEGGAESVIISKLAILYSSSLALLLGIGALWLSTRKHTEESSEAELDAQNPSATATPSQISA